MGCQYGKSGYQWGNKDDVEKSARRIYLEYISVAADGVTTALTYLQHPSASTEHQRVKIIQCNSSTLQPPRPLPLHPRRQQPSQHLPIPRLRNLPQYNNPTPKPLIRRHLPINMAPYILQHLPLISCLRLGGECHIRDGHLGPLVVVPERAHRALKDERVRVEMCFEFSRGHLIASS